MKRGHLEEAVRPLGERPAHREPRSRPGLVATALVVIGAAAGYLVGLPAETSADLVPTTTAPGAVAAGGTTTPVADYDWVTPSGPSTRSPTWRVIAATDFEGDIYVLVLDDFEDRRLRSVWRSPDGADWEPVPLDFGTDVIVTDLDVHDGSLLLSGWDGGRPALWSSPEGVSAQTRWEQILLPGESLSDASLIEGASAVSTEVNAAGEIVVVADLEYEISDLALSLSSDPAVESVLQFDEWPKVAVTDDLRWIRIVDPGGSETVQVIETPAELSIRPLGGRLGVDITGLEAWRAWTSDDGSLFEPVLMPEEVTRTPRIMALGDGFVASAPTETLDFALLHSADGAGWESWTGDIPDECGSQKAAAAANGMVLLVSKNFDHSCTTDDGTTWLVHPSPRTIISSNGFVGVDGGNKGFLVTSLNSVENAVLESPDGVNWRRVGFADGIIGGRSIPVGDRILTIARSGFAGGQRSWTVSVGTMTDR